MLHSFLPSILHDFLAFLNISTFPPELLYQSAFRVLEGPMQGARVHYSLFALFALFIPSLSIQFHNPLPYVCRINRPRYVFSIHGAEHNAPNLAAW